MRRSVATIAALVAVGCHDLSGNSTVPSGTLDPKIYNTPGGVQQQAQGLRTLFGIALNKMIFASGTLTDELTIAGELNLRQLSERTDPTGPLDPAFPYGTLQDVRVQSNLTARVIAANALAVSPVVRGQLYAYEGYSEILLADLYCSGIPLTTLDLSGTVNYQPASPRDSVYARAVVAFDSAIALADTSNSLLILARVGKGRALLALGQYAAAAQAVTAVATGDLYTQNIVLGVPLDLNKSISPSDFGNYSIADREGGNGLAYLSSGDPRTAVIAFLDSAGVNTYYAPAKYYQSPTGSDSIPMIVASGVEARLIEAEVALHAGNASWLTTLNALRTDGTYTVTTIFDPVTNDSIGTDTVWNAGTGGVAGLQPLEDPGTPQARVDTLFAERAEWLFLTGHRQGDLRRLIRQYQRRSTQLYPVGAFPLGGTYGIDITVPVPSAERRNPQFHGCLNRDA